MIADGLSSDGVPTAQGGRRWYPVTPCLEHSFALEGRARNHGDGRPEEPRDQGHLLVVALADFRDYFAAQIASETISVTAPARDVAAVILEAPLPAPLRVLVPAHRLSTAGLLPARLRQEYGLRWSPLHELVLPLAARSVKLTTMPVLIAASRLSPPRRALAA